MFVTALKLHPAHAVWCSRVKSMIKLLWASPKTCSLSYGLDAASCCSPALLPAIASIPSSAFYFFCFSFLISVWDSVSVCLNNFIAPTKKALKRDFWETSSGNHPARCLCSESELHVDVYSTTWHSTINKHIPTSSSNLPFSCLVCILKLVILVCPKVHTGRLGYGRWCSQFFESW